jgi:UDP-GlcNAc:undecaprenyl-phosphate/decaprenyl-phosphate GlcNAc-1-phosphate transferase
VGSDIFGGSFSLAASATACWLIVATQTIHGSHTQDTVAGGPQKFSPRPVPRVGGIALFVAVLIASSALAQFGVLAGEEILLLSIAGVPALMGGLLEDLTKRIPVYTRLVFAFVSAAIAFFLLDARIISVDLPFFDVLLATSVGSLVFTIFAVGGMAHAMNIIDGFNGLFGMCALVVLAAIGAVAYSVGDSMVLAGASVVAGAVLGFLIFNFPKGQLFAGDGGAYFIGFLIAELTVLLIFRNSEVSPWFALAVLVYPVFETVFSMYRKHFVRGRSVGKPDGVHLHMLIYRRLVRWHPASKAVEHRVARNSLTSPYLWVLCALGAVGAVTFWNKTPLLQVGVVVFALVYIWLYRRIVHFSVPKALIIRSPVAPSEWMEDTHSRGA